MSVLHHTVRTVTPFHDVSRKRRLGKVAAWFIGIAAVLALCHLAGFGLLDWFENLWQTMTAISPGYIVAGVFFQTIQTSLTALAWYSVLTAAFPDGGARYRDILAAYAAGVALNGVLPANIGSFASLLMYVALIRGSTFPGVIGATVVQKIFFVLIGAFVYVYLFISVPGTLNLQLGIVDAHRLLVPLLIVGGGVLVALLVKVFWSRVKGLWEKAKQGGSILEHKRDYVVKVLLPSFGSWIAKLVVVGIFLAAYSIPVTFHTIMSVIGGNSLANLVSFTPGGVGITQVVNSVSLASVTTTTNAAAYSLGQQIIVTAWNITFATAVVTWVFGWTGGKQLVGTSYTGAKEEAAAQSAARKERKAEKKEGKRAEHDAGPGA
ncbi:MAG: flippase-like domain-containing protein [Thermoleophilia bacterium]|nr:flippase-like domain-containing protein [Thermoleophilia bacterium]